MCFICVVERCSLTVLVTVILGKLMDDSFLDRLHGQIVFIGNRQPPDADEKHLLWVEEI